jgi:hypothetical protein
MVRRTLFSDISRLHRRVSVGRRLPWPMAAALIFGISLAAWIGIFFLVRYML